MKEKRSFFKPLPTSENLDDPVYKSPGHVIGPANSAKPESQRKYQNHPGMVIGKQPTPGSVDPKAIDNAAGPTKIKIGKHSG